MSTQNYYEILGLKQSCCRKDIKKKYRELALQCHPDKGGSEEVFEKITLAYNTLVNKEERKKYNENINNIYESHFILKKKLEKFINTENIINQEDDNEKINFLQFTDLDRNIPTKLNQNELTQRINELELAREQEDIEITQDSLFNNDNKFDDEIFNANFVISNTKDNKIIKQEKPTQYNLDNYNESNKDIFGFDLNNKLKKYDDPNKDYKIAKNASKKKIDKIKNSLNIHSHNILEQNYNKNMEDLLKNRESETLFLNNLKRKDYNKNDQSYIISKNE